MNINLSEEDVDSIKQHLSAIKQKLKNKELTSNNQIDMFGFTSEQIVFVYFMLNAFQDDLFSFNLQNISKQTIETIKANYSHLLKEDLEDYDKMCDYFKEKF